MGPRARYLGPEVPAEELIWQDPIPAVDHKLIDGKDIADLKAKILASGLSVSELVSTAWASASTFRGSDKRGGANGARIRLAPQKDWEVNQPAQLAKVLETLEGIQKAFNDGAVRRQEGLAGRPDRARRLRGGREGGEGRRPRRRGALHAGPHRRLAGADRRRVVRRRSSRSPTASATTSKAAVRRVGRGAAGRQGAAADADRAGDDGARRRPARARRQLRGSPSTASSPKRPGTLTNDFFVNLLDMGTAWKAASEASDVFEGRDRKTGELKWTGTRVDLVFGSQLAAARARRSLWRRRRAGEVRDATSSRPGPR